MCQVKQKIVIVLYEDDGQIDVETYLWEEEKKQKIRLLEEETVYGLQTKEEANEFVNILYEQFEVVKLTSLEEEEEERKQSMPPLPVLKPQYLTYELDKTGLLNYIKQWYYQNYGVDVPFYFDSPTESDGQQELYLYIEEEELSEMATRELERTTEFQKGKRYDFADEVFEKIFKEPLLYYRNDPYRDAVIINVPIKK